MNVIAAIVEPADPEVLAALLGMSALTIALYVGDPLPLVGPARKKFCDVLLSAKLKAGVVVGAATEVVNKGERLPALKELTPDPVPLNVQVVPVQETPEPPKVKAPVVEFILDTPEPLPPQAVVENTPSAEIPFKQFPPAAVEGTTSVEFASGI